MPEPEPHPRPGHDLRMPVLGCAAWLGGIAATRAGDLAVAVLGALVVVAGALAWSGRGARASPRRRLALASVVLGAAVLAGSLLRLAAVATSPLSAWADDRGDRRPGRHRGVRPTPGRGAVG